MLLEPPPSDAWKRRKELGMGPGLGRSQTVSRRSLFRSNERGHRAALRWLFTAAGRGLGGLVSARREPRSGGSVATDVMSIQDVVTKGISTRSKGASSWHGAMFAMNNRAWRGRFQEVTLEALLRKGATHFAWLRPKDHGDPLRLRAVHDQSHFIFRCVMGKFGQTRDDSEDGVRLEAIDIRNKKLLGAPGIATRSKDATRGSWPYY